MQRLLARVMLIACAALWVLPLAGCTQSGTGEDETTTDLRHIARAYGVILGGKNRPPKDIEEIRQVLSELHTDGLNPPAEEVLKKYVEATGGAEAYEALKTQHASGTFSMPAMGMEGKFELFQEQPDKFLALVTLPGMGEIQTGLSGKTGWRTDPMQGPRLLEGEELKSLTRDADMRAVLVDLGLAK